MLCVVRLAMLRLRTKMGGKLSIIASAYRRPFTLSDFAESAVNALLYIRQVKAALR